MLGEGIEQFYVFCAFCALGITVALPYLFALGLLKSKIANFIFDFIYCACALALLWKFNLELNNGEFRLFVFIGFFVGVAISCVSCKTTLDKLSFRLYNIFKSQAERDEAEKSKRK